MRYLRYMSRGTSRTIGFSIGPDWALHSSFAPHSDLVTVSMNKWFSVNLLDEPIGEVSTTPSRSSPSFHQVTEGLGLPVNQSYTWFFYQSTLLIRFVRILLASWYNGHIQQKSTFNKRFTKSISASQNKYSPECSYSVILVGLYI